MARADTATLLPLDRFARVLGAHPLHFNGVYHESLAPATTCSSPLMQYDWQTADGVARESIAIAIQDAEDRITQWLGFRPLPLFEFDERHSIPRPASPGVSYMSLTTVTGGISIRLDKGHLIAGGYERRDPVVLNSPVTYTDDDADGYAETATIIASTTSVDPDEIVICFPGEGGGREWEIRPITVSIAGGFATIICRREQLVIPSIWEKLSDHTRGVDGADDANFVPNVDVYKVWHDPSQQVQFLWENDWVGCGCGSYQCQTCYLSAQFGCTVVRDYRLGLIVGSPALWNSVTSAYEYTPYAVGRAPDRARFWYRAGYRDQRRARPMHEMDSRWERAIAVLAATLLERPFCSCRNVENITNYWREDLAVNVPTASQRLSNKWLDNPIGTTRGAVHAWRLIRSEAIGDAVNI